MNYEMRFVPLGTYIGYDGNICHTKECKIIVSSGMRTKTFTPKRVLSEKDKEYIRNIIALYDYHDFSSLCMNVDLILNSMFAVDDLTKNRDQQKIEMKEFDLDDEQYLAFLTEV